MMNDPSEFEGVLEPAIGNSGSCKDLFGWLIGLIGGQQPDINNEDLPTDPTISTDNNDISPDEPQDNPQDPSTTWESNHTVHLDNDTFPAPAINKASTTDDHVSDPDVNDTSFLTNHDDDLSYDADIHQDEDEDEDDFLPNMHIFDKELKDFESNFWNSDKEFGNVATLISDPGEPKTFCEAWDHPDPIHCSKWRETIHKEFSMKDIWCKQSKKTIPNNRRLIGSQWVLKIKRNGVYRARLCALGYSQLPGLDYTEILPQLSMMKLLDLWY